MALQPAELGHLPVAPRPHVQGHVGEIQPVIRGPVHHEVIQVGGQVPAARARGEDDPHLLDIARATPGEGQGQVVPGAVGGHLLPPG